MAKAEEAGWAEQVAEIAECPICTDKITNNRLLPCGHTFCLKCLEKYRKSIKGKSLPCPVCRQLCSIPKGGCTAFPKNVMVEKLLEVNSEKRENEVAQCEACESGKKAEVRCIQCEQNFCNDCGKLHQKLKIAVSHNVIPVSKISSNFPEMCTPKDNYCEHHPGHPLELLCVSCNTEICWKCRVVIHSSHTIAEIQEVIEEQRSQLRIRINEISQRLSVLKTLSGNIQEQKQQYRKCLEEEMGHVAKVTDDLIRIITTNASELVKQMRLTLTYSLKTIEPYELLVETQTDELKKHKTYIEQLSKRENGKKMFRMAEELNRKSSKLLSIDLPNITINALSAMFMSDVDIQHQLIPKPQVGRIHSFHSLPLHQLQWAQIFGIQSPEDKKKDSQPKDQNKFQCNRNENSKSPEISRLNGSVLNCISLGNGSVVSAVAISKHKIFVAIEANSDIIVYRTDNHQTLPTLRVPNMRQCWDLAFCQRHNFLYLADWETRSIFRTNTEDAESAKSWSTGGDTGGISLTPDSTLLLSCHISSLLVEYNVSGETINSTEIVSDKEESIHPWHALKLPSGEFVVSHGDRDTLHRVCLLSSKGAVLKSFGEHQGSGVDQLFGPYHLTIDLTQNFLFVADCNNSRILILNTDLNYVGEISTDLRRPKRMYMDAENRRLFVTDNALTENILSDGKVVVFSTDFHYSSAL